MKIAHSAFSCLAHRALRRSAICGVAASLIVAGDHARAQDPAQPIQPVMAVSPSPAMIETWICTDHEQSPRDRRPPLELVQKDGLLIEQPLGTPRYSLLANSAYAIVGVDHYADFEPVFGAVDIFVSTVIIDRTTGAFAISTSVSNKAHEYRTGRCRKFESGAGPGNDQALARRK